MERLWWLLSLGSSPRHVCSLRPPLFAGRCGDADVCVGDLGASTVDCSYALITSAADAELVGKNCPTVNGNITFATSESVNLDGVQVIEGNISNSQAVYECDWENRIHGPCNSTGPFTISMPSLTTVHGNLHFEGYLDLANLSLPKLTQINQFFLDSVYNLTYMDITELDTLSSFSIDRTRRLATMRHTGLRNYTGQPLNYFNTLWISDTSLDSVDSIFSNPFNLSGIPQSWAFVGFDMMPNLRRATFGIASADYVRLGGGNVTITFGGPTTRTMDLDTIDLSGGVGGFERHPNLQNISVGVISTPIGNNNFTSLSLPFDQLGKLDLQGETKVQQISNLPQAVSWTNFTLSITLCDALNLSSQSEPNAAGQLGQTWYWPQTDMESVAIEGGYFTENFL